ncbi:homeodomain mating-type protein [Coprinopsis cinerea okayama7|uniref:Homeodomain mating-type protein n=1 Tax=Coprinopsis cinerea (strain Okayama-7 / 130 / ATCC MYA-4618 / FGSC 9003) TaxID=240176 RepID=D6RK41_COPC7|nr:homeodomain mating-type protein [Coprinopsis cinerea okayama7\|eukprot:XP_002912171.1 homeodomain mating-type protein [Coprinopsis cinerea okayama7\
MVEVQKSRKDMWLQLSRASQSWTLRARQRPSQITSSSASSSSYAIPPLQLTIPDDFIADLSLTPEARGQILLRIKDTIMKVHENGYANLCRDYSKKIATHSLRFDALVISGARDAYQRSFNEQLSQLQLEIERLSHQFHAPSAKRTPFNSEYTPLLEKYFEYHAYPSARDREWLARKTMMTTRQIEVWFQNHRRRARKEGIHFERLPMDRLPVQLSLEDLEDKLSPLTSPRNHRHKNHRIPTPPPERSAASPEPCLGVSSRGDSILDHTYSPPHAFPTKYNKVQRHDDLFSFPRVDCIPAPMWDRRPSQSHSAPTYTIEQLCETLASMRIHGPAMDEGCDQPRPWYACRVTGPISAPHPALTNPSRPTLRLATTRSSSKSPAPRRGRQPSTPIPQRSNRRRGSTSPMTALSPSFPNSRRRVIPRLSSHSSLSSIDSSDLDTPDGSPPMPPISTLPPAAEKESIHDPLSVDSPVNKAPCGRILPPTFLLIASHRRSEGSHIYRLASPHPFCSTPLSLFLVALFSSSPAFDTLVHFIVFLRLSKGLGALAVDYRWVVGPFKGIQPSVHPPAGLGCSPQAVASTSQTRSTAALSDLEQQVEAKRELEELEARAKAIRAGIPTA